MQYTLGLLTNWVFMNGLINWYTNMYKHTMLKQHRYMTSFKRICWSCCPIHNHFVVQQKITFRWTTKERHRLARGLHWEIWDMWVISSCYLYNYLLENNYVHIYKGKSRETAFTSWEFLKRSNEHEIINLNRPFPLLSNYADEACSENGSYLKLHNLILSWILSASLNVVLLKDIYCDNYQASLFLYSK